MFKRLISILFVVVTPLLLGGTLMSIGGLKYAIAAQVQLAELGINPVGHEKLVSLSFLVGLFLLMLSVGLISKSVELSHNNDGTVSLGAGVLFPASDVQVRRIIPGLLLVKVKGLKMVSFG